MNFQKCTLSALFCCPACVSCIELPYTIDFCVGKTVGVAAYISSNIVFAQEFMKAVTVVLVCVQIVASMPMLAAIDIRNRNERLVAKYENERFFIGLQILPDPFVQRFTVITICSSICPSVILYIDY